MAGLQIRAHQRMGLSTKALRPKRQIDGDDEGEGGRHDDVHRGGHGTHRIDQHLVDAVGGFVEQLLPVDALQPVHQPAHVGVLCAEVGGPAGDVRLDLQIKAVERFDQFRHQQGQRKHQHQHDADQRDEKAEETKGLVRRLLFGLAKQLLQPLFQPGHGHVDEKCQDAARQYGQHQIHKTCRKGEHIRKPQQCNKKCYPHNGDEQRAFGVRIHDEVPFPECTAASWNEAAAEPLLYCTRCAGLVKTAGKGSAHLIRSCAAPAPGRRP